MRLRRLLRRPPPSRRSPRAWLWNGDQSSALGDRRPDRLHLVDQHGARRRPAKYGWSSAGRAPPRTRPAPRAPARMPRRIGAGRRAARGRAALASPPYQSKNACSNGDLAARAGTPTTPADKARVRAPRRRGTGRAAAAGRARSSRRNAGAKRCSAGFQGALSAKRQQAFREPGQVPEQRVGLPAVGVEPVLVEIGGGEVRVVGAAGTATDRSRNSRR